MFWKTPRSWLNASSTRNELSTISHLRDGSGVCARDAAVVASSAASVARTTRSCMSARIDLDQQLRRGTRADRDLPILAAQHHRIGGVVARLDFDRFTRLETIALDEAEKRRILIRDARDPERRAERTGQQVLEMTRGDFAVRTRNRI